MTIRNPLFDPRSDYNRRRLAVDSAEKLQGYFHWLSEFKALAQRRAAEAAALVVKLAPPPNPLANTADRTMAAKGAPVPPRTVVLGCRDEAAEGIEAVNAEAVVSMQQRMGQYYLFVDVDINDWPSPCLCRAYLLEPARRQRLLRALGRASSSDELDQLALQTIFGRSGIGANRRLIRLLADVPEIEGPFKNAQARLEAKLPMDEPLVTRDDFYKRDCWIIVALDNQFLPETSNVASVG